MYTCICNAIRESELARTAREYGGNAESLYARLGFTPKCRQCLEEAELIVEDARRYAPAGSCAVPAACIGGLQQREMRCEG